MADPTWNDPIKEWLAPYVDCMLDNGYDLGKHDKVKKDIKDIKRAIDNKSMPQGNPWPEDKIKTFDLWVEQGCK